MIRFANEKDFDFVKNSWSVCFDDPPEFVDWNFKYNYSKENTLIAEIDGTSASVMQLMPYTLMLGEHEVSARYVSGVATLPEYRGKGLVRELFDDALPKMYDMDAAISILFPAVDGMYEKFGYTKIYKRNFYKADKLCGQEICSLDDVPFERMDKIYLKNMHQNGVYIKRSKSDWEKIITDLIKLSGGKVLLFENGYALAYPKDEHFEVCEICGSCDISGTPVPQFPVMARIINAEKIQRLFPEVSNFGIYDTFIPENNHPFKNEANTIDISDLTKLLFNQFPNGYINMLL